MIVLYMPWIKHFVFENIATLANFFSFVVLSAIRNNHFNCNRLLFSVGAVIFFPLSFFSSCHNSACWKSWIDLYTNRSGNVPWHFTMWTISVHFTVCMVVKQVWLTIAKWLEQEIEHFKSNCSNKEYVNERKWTNEWMSQWNLCVFVKYSTARIRLDFWR